MKQKLSVVLLTRNEEVNIKSCLESVRNIADEIVILDENSNDKTVRIAKNFGAKVYQVKHSDNFHINKQKAINKATGDWILQLDADERVSSGLEKEIENVIRMTDDEIREYQKLQSSKRPKLRRLFQRHQRLIEQREPETSRRWQNRLLRGGSGSVKEIVAFFIPRRNFFLGKPLIHAGVYPDGVIRLIKWGKARLPARSVHEVMEVDGEVGWLFNDLEHHESPTFSRYLSRMNRYTDLTAKEFNKKQVPTNILFLLYYSFLKPLHLFLLFYLRHKGFLDGTRGFVWSLFSALHFPIAYFKYWQFFKIKK